MCKKLTAVYLETLGSRKIGWHLWNGLEAVGMTETQLRGYIQNGGQINGLRLNEQGKIEIDPEWGGMMLAKSGINTFSPIAPDTELIAAKSFMLVRVVQGSKANRYEFITNRWGHECMEEDQVKAMLTIMPMGGIRLEGKKLVVHKDVEILKDYADTSE